MTHRLPVLQTPFDRRQALLLGAAAGVAACGPTANFGLIDEVLPRSTDAADDDASDPGLDVGSAPVDTGTVTYDSGPVLRDSGPVLRDSGPATRPDAGTVPRDSGPAFPPDTGPMIRDSGPATPPDTGPTCTPRGTMVGAVDSLPMGTFRMMGRGSSTVIVGRDAGGFYAMSGVCPHQGCAVNAPVGGAIACPCHGARFDANGTVTRGPARTSLPHREVTVCDGVVYLGTATVAASTRTPA